MGDLIRNILDQASQRYALIVGLGAVILALLFLGLTAITRPDYAPLFTNLSTGSANSVQTTLSSAGINAAISEDGSGVSVPREDLARARMVVAEAGGPVDGEPGWELFDDQSGLAMNSFLQRVNRLRAMEGELARSIKTLDGIQSARVHLVLPEREPFSTEIPAPRASVILRPNSGRAVTKKQAIAVRNLVASAVSELEVGRVTVLSANGETILAQEAGNDGQVTIQSTKTAIEDRLSREITSILTARVGAGNARVRVNVDLTTEREMLVEQTFDPDQQVVRSTESKSENQSDTDSGGNVGVENNIPAALAEPGGAGATNNRSESDETVRYEIGNTRREIVREAGDVKRITVAVLVNGIYAVDGADVEYTERSEEELARLSELIKSAVGFEAERGDSVSVDSMRFMDYSMDLGEPVSTSATERLADNIVPIVRGLMGIVLIGLVLLLGVRPLLRQLNPDPTKELDAPEAEGALEAPQGDALAADAQPGLPQLEGAGGAGQLPGAGAMEGGVPALPGQAAEAGALAPLDDEALVTTDGIAGGLQRKKIDLVRTLADEKPDEALRVLRQWLMAEAEA
ncbi:MAG: flagellar M-ring protein FliF [Rhodobacteraceae bacterium]|nr:flagellar M-ring protein FliF [Paracoccaceae bacterium]